MKKLFLAIAAISFISHRSYCPQTPERRRVFEQGGTPERNEVSTCYPPDRFTDFQAPPGAVPRTEHSLMDSVLPQAPRYTTPTLAGKRGAEGHANPHSAKRQCRDNT